MINGGRPGANAPAPPLAWTILTEGAADREHIPPRPAQKKSTTRGGSCFSLFRTDNPRLPCESGLIKPFN
jgi:hypothetical protein